MRIVDLRPAAVRGLTGRWRTAGGPPPAPAALGGLATRLADAWQARQASRRPPPPSAPFVVSIGNLALGGTGKTPVTCQLALDLAAAGLRGAVLTRGYGSPRRGPVAVAPGLAGAGDEARLLAAALEPAGWIVVQARRRARGLAWLRDRCPGLDVVLLEDGHQTAGVGRHLDVVILDAWDLAPGPAGGAPRLRALTGAVAPWGPWRESARGAARAGIWLVESGAPPPAPPGVAVAGFARAFRLALPPGADAAAPVLLSGIARPGAFEAEAARHLAAAPALAVRCADHEPYGPRLLARLDECLAAAGATVVVTTAKDRVKLEPVWGARAPLAVLEMRVVWTGEKALPELVRERRDAVCRGDRTG